MSTPPPYLSPARGERCLNLADLFEVVADACPDRLALVAGDVRLTYRELDERANRLGHHLASPSGGSVAPGEFVGVYAWNRAEWVEAMIACFKIRAVPININFRYVEEELRYLFDNADLVALIHDAEFSDKVAAVTPSAPALRYTLSIEDDYEDALAAASPARDFATRSPDDLYVLYTGGTTGMPKGVLWRSEDIFLGAMGGGNFSGPPITSPEDLAAGAAKDPTIQVVMPPMMHGGAQWVSWITLTNAGTAVLYTSHKFDPDEVLSIAQREGAHGMMFVGDAMGRPIAEALAAAREKGEPYDLSKLFLVGSGGSILSRAVKDQLRAELPNVLVMDSFGASETGANGSVMDTGGPSAGPRFTMGPHTTVLDDHLAPVSPGSAVVGRLAKSGHIPLGYHKDPEKTAATFVTGPDGMRWVLPGDHATIEEDGSIILLGRGSVSINTGGEKVFPEEVEAALKSHPDVFDAVVVGVPDERFVERVAAIVLPRAGRNPTLEDLAEHCRGHIAGYKVPRQLHLVDAIQRTPAGKPDYRWAKARALAET